MQEYSVTGTLSIGGEGRWDYITVDPAAQLLYVTRSTHTQVIDSVSGKLVADIPGHGRLHGTALDPKVNRGYITDGEGAKVTVFDMKTHKVLADLAAVDDADGITYDSGTDRVLVACGDAQQLLVLDPNPEPSAEKFAHVDLGGKPESAVADGKGRAFVCINDKNEIAAVDLGTLKVTARYKIGTGTGPTGLAIDTESGTLFVGCRNKKMIVLDTDGGNVLAELPIGTGNDACAAYPLRHEAFASCGDGTVTIVRETNLKKFEVVQTLTTARGARTMTIDSVTGKLFLPTALFGPATGERRQPPLPNTFMIVVASPSAEATAAK